LTVEWDVIIFVVGASHQHACTPFVKNLIFYHCHRLMAVVFIKITIGVIRFLILKEFHMQKQNLPEIFNHDDFGQVRVIMINDEPYAVARDVAIALGYSNPDDAMERHCDDLAKTEVTDYTGRRQLTNIIPESDIYALIIGSKLPSAKKFRDWVFKEVLPSIRQTGMYGIPKDLPTALEAYAKTLRELATTQAQLAIDAPKVEAYNDLIEAEGTLSMSEVAKILALRVANFKLGRNGLYAFLRRQKIIRPKSTEPFQQYVDSGCFFMRSMRLQNNRVETYTRVTPKGLEMIYNRLKKANLGGA
jgi:anti-repressor protein